MDENTKINEMNITDEFFKVWSNTKGNVVAQNLHKLGPGGVVLVTKAQDEVIGYITEKEITDCVATGGNPKKIVASELMNTNFMEVMEDVTLGELLPEISERYPNAIIVTNHDYKCVGFFSNNDYREALAGLGYYDQSHEPENAEEWCAKGLAMSSKGNSKLALECYTKSLALHTDEERAWFKLAKRFEGSFRFKDALMCYDKVLSFNANNDRAWVNRGNIYSAQKTHNLALQSYNYALNANPENADAIINMGLTLSDMGNINDAIAYFDKAKAIKGESAELWYRKGNAFEKVGLYKAALSCYETAIKLDNNYEEAWFSKGITLHQLGEETKAIQCLEMILKINPINKSAKQALVNKDVNKPFESLTTNPE